MPSTPESEETRPTDAEEAAAEALYLIRGVRLGAYPFPTWDGLDELDRACFRTDARAALEAAAALHPPREAERCENEWASNVRCVLPEGHDGWHKRAMPVDPPREGAGGDEHTRDEWASLRRELDSVAEERDVYRQACGRTREGLQRDLSTTEAALATTIEQRDQAEHQAAAAEAALADAKAERDRMRETARLKVERLKLAEAALAEAERLSARRKYDLDQLIENLATLGAALAESRGEVERLRETAEALVFAEGWRPPLTPDGRAGRALTAKSKLAQVVFDAATDEWRARFENRWAESDGGGCPGYEGNWPYEPCHRCGRSGVHASHIVQVPPGATGEGS